MKLFCRSRNNQNDILEAEKKYIYNWFFYEKSNQSMAEARISSRFPAIFNFYDLSEKKSFSEEQNTDQKPFFILESKIFLAKQCSNNYQHKWKKKCLAKQRKYFSIYFYHCKIQQIFEYPKARMQCRNEMKCRSIHCRSQLMKNIRK